MLDGVMNQTPFIFILLSFYSENHGPHSYIYLVIQCVCSNSSQHFCISTCKKEKIEGEGTSQMLHRLLLLVLLWSNIRPAVTSSFKEGWAVQFFILESLGFGWLTFRASIFMREEERKH